MKAVIYQDGAGEWRWRIVAPNGRIVADGSEGYDSKSNAKRAIGDLIDEIRVSQTAIAIAVAP